MEQVGRIGKPLAGTRLRAFRQCATDDARALSSTIRQRRQDAKALRRLRMDTVVGRETGARV